MNERYTFRAYAMNDLGQIRERATYVEYSANLEDVKQNAKVYAAAVGVVVDVVSQSEYWKPIVSYDPLGNEFLPR